MTVIMSGEHIVVGAGDYLVGERIPCTEEAILALEATRQLIAARRITDDDNLATMNRPVSFSEYPTPPTAITPEATDRERDAFRRAMDMHVRAVTRYINRDSEPTPTPVAVGYAQTITDNRSYFRIDHHNSPTSSILPYDGTSTMLYKLELAEIVDIP